MAKNASQPITIFKFKTNHQTRIKIIKWHNIDELNQVELKIYFNLKMVAKQKNNNLIQNKIYTF